MHWHACMDWGRDDAHRAGDDVHCRHAHTSLHAPACLYGQDGDMMCFGQDDAGRGWRSLVHLDETRNTNNALFKPYIPHSVAPVRRVWR